jgi:hypothetical protein
MTDLVTPMKHNIPHILAHMIDNLNEAAATVRAIQLEYEANGTDSLANIDYGAALNADLMRVRNQFDMLDQAGLFTLDGGETDA